VSASTLASIGVGEFLAALLLAAALSMWVYWHASRHRSRHATAWGVSAFLFVGFFAYLIHHYATRRRF
jgi:drug/metabolite transporter (DMT)-like permease